MVFQRLLATAMFFGLAVSSASAVQTTLTIQLGEDQLTDFERKTVPFTCTVDDPISVSYINAAPNFLAMVPIEGATLIMSGVESASGSKYVAGRWVWWVKGAEARLYDLTQGEAAEPVNVCTEVNNTP